MQYINPIEILDLYKLPLNEINGHLIKKQKKKLFAEVELSGNEYFSYHSIEVTKSEIDRAINELEITKRVEYYHFTANKQLLNNFLITGDESFFSSFKFESIYNLPSFLVFISPFFTDKYDKVLLRAFQKNDVVRLTKIVAVKPLAILEDIDKAYKSLLNAIRDRIKEIDKLSREIRDEESEYDEDNIGDILDWVKERLNAQLLNALPLYFQSMRNQAAHSIRNLSVHLFNSFEESEIALDLIDYALDFDVDDLISQKLNADYNQIKEIHDRNVEEERNAPILKKYAMILIGIRNKYKEVENMTLNPNLVDNWVSVNVSIHEINSLDKTFDEIKYQIALGIRALSVAVWNRYKEIGIALKLINIACGINTRPEIRQSFLNDRIQLVQTKKSLDLLNQSVQRKMETVSRTERSASNNSVLLYVIIGLVAAILMIAISLSVKESSKSTNSKNTNRSKTQSETSTGNSNTRGNESKTTNSGSEKIKYDGNQLRDGASPFDGCFGNGRFGGSAWIRFDNSNESDAIVCLVKVATGETVRNEYIRAGSKLTMKRVPTGTYYLKVYYGNDWNPTKQNFCGTSGAFERNESYSKSDNPGDHIKVVNSSKGYSTHTITLYSVPYGNMSTQKTGASEFFKK